MCDGNLIVVLAFTSKHFKQGEFKVGRPERWIVAIPAKNEAERLYDALRALDDAAAFASRKVHALVLANNCCDETADLASGFKGDDNRLQIEVRSQVLPTHLAHAGGARLTAVTSVDCARRL